MAPTIAAEYSSRNIYYKVEPGTSPLNNAERLWRDQQSWLKERGYLFRPRYQSDWIPSWTTDISREEKRKAEDRLHGIFGPVMDVTRMSDGSFVLLKHTYMGEHRDEVEITKFFSSEPIKTDPRNHCVPLLDVFPFPHHPDDFILVLPLLKEFDGPRFETFGEAMSAFTQLFEGLQFMHEHNVAHRDWTAQNIMMDATALYRHPYHPAKPSRRRDWKGKAKAYTRTQRPVKYYLIDFGFSIKFDPEEPRLAYPSLGGDKTVPEHVPELHGTPCNPFQTDVYYIGNLIRLSFLQRYWGFGFMKPLIADMVQVDMAKRPTMDEVVTRFHKIRDGLSWWKLRSRLVERKEFFVYPWRTARHWYLTATYVATGKAAIPAP
ncbi:kinase-like domain-containing protein [Amylostereum chailletii]|nr:kinase-like domain-containing protein [Amylostereum chailletii]